MHQSELKDKKLRHFVNRYTEEFGWQIVSKQIFKNLLSPKKIDNLMLEKAIKERAYTTEFLQTFSKKELYDLLDFLDKNTRNVLKKRQEIIYLNMLYFGIIGFIGGFTIFSSKLNLFWFLPLVFFFFFKFFQINKKYCDIEATYSSLKYWVNISLNKQFRTVKLSELIKNFYKKKLYD